LSERGEDFAANRVAHASVGREHGEGGFGRVLEMARELRFCTDGGACQQRAKFAYSGNVAEGAMLRRHDKPSTADERNVRTDAPPALSPSGSSSRSLTLWCDPCVWPYEAHGPLSRTGVPGLGDRHRLLWLFDRSDAVTP
jgi:hypothetical protein